MPAPSRYPSREFVGDMLGSGVPRRWQRLGQGIDHILIIIEIEDCGNVAAHFKTDNVVLANWHHEKRERYSNDATLMVTRAEGINAFLRNSANSGWIYGGIAVHSSIRMRRFLMPSASRAYSSNSAMSAKNTFSSRTSR